MKNLHSFVGLRSGKRLAHQYQYGLTLIELMISIGLGLMVVAAASALLVSSKAAYMGQDNNARLQDTARYAIDTITRAVRQSGYEDWAGTVNDTAAYTNTSEFISGVDQILQPGIFGLDNNSVGATSNDISVPLGVNAVGNSDVLAVRFFGSGPAGAADNTVTTCQGVGVSEPTSETAKLGARGWSIFYVAIEAASGEPQLYCKSNNDGSAWTAQSIASGVESFQVIYGFDNQSSVYLPSPPNPAKSLDPEYGTIDRYLTATQINTLDAARATPATTPSLWTQVRVVKIALLVRGTDLNRVDLPNKIYPLFGADYDSVNGAADPGSKISEATLLPVTIRDRVRKPFLYTIQVRNSKGLVK